MLCVLPRAFPSAGVGHLCLLTPHFKMLSDRNDTGPGQARDEVPALGNNLIARVTVSYNCLMHLQEYNKDKYCTLCATPVCVKKT